MRFGGFGIISGFKLARGTKFQLISKMECRGFNHDGSNGNGIYFPSNLTNPYHPCMVY